MEKESTIRSKQCQHKTQTTNKTSDVLLHVETLEDISAHGPVAVWTQRNPPLSEDSKRLCTTMSFVQLRRNIEILSLG